MAPKRKKKATAPAPAPARKAAPRFIRGLLRSVVEFFKDELPVSPVQGAGKFATEVVTKGAYQAEIAAACAELPDTARVKANRWRCSALVTPTDGADLNVVVAGLTVGVLKPKDAKRLLQRMVDAHQDLFSLRVDALIEGGGAKKAGKPKPFVIRLDIPVLYPPKPVRPPRETPSAEPADDEQPIAPAKKAKARKTPDEAAGPSTGARVPNSEVAPAHPPKLVPARRRRRKGEVQWEDAPVSPDRTERGGPMEL